MIDYRVLADSERPLALVIEHDGARSATSLLAWMALASTASTVLLLVNRGGLTQYVAIQGK